jgi:hypothetical protein
VNEQARGYVLDDQGKVRQHMVIFSCSAVREGRQVIASEPHTAEAGHTFTARDRVTICWRWCWSKASPNM